MSSLASNSHPAEPELVAYARGELAEVNDRQIEQHLEECEACCQTLSRLSSDTLVAILRRPLPAAPETHATLPGEFGTAISRADTPTLAPHADATRVPEQSPHVAGLPAELANHAKYEIRATLGQGGMGSVYLAQHRMMNRLVALKVINQQLVRSDSAVKRFHREVRAAAQLSHPNIVAAHDAEQAGNVHFLVMEYVDGVDLSEVLAARGPLPVAEASDYARQAALGLAHAHELGMVHRDIKPQNLMVCKARRSPASPSDVGSNDAQRRAAPTGLVLKILDFGLANFAAEVMEPSANEAGEAGPTFGSASHLTMSGAMMGTPDYISPEQSKDAHTADIRSDIYSLGCTLYSLLSGKPPFAEGSVVEKILAHAEREPRKLSELRYDLPDGLEVVIGRMMAKNPAERYATPSDVAAALAPYATSTAASGLGLAQHAKNEIPATTKALPRRSKASLGIAAAVCLAFFAVLAGVIVVVTDRGRLEIRSQVEDVQVQVMQGATEVAVIDLKSGSQVRWLPTGNYELALKGNANAVKFDRNGFEMSRLGKVVVYASWKPAGPSVRPIGTPEGTKVGTVPGQPPPMKPVVPRPRPDLPPGQNLITDPSLENTRLGASYPEGWGIGNMVPPKTYKHSVVEGGRTGKHGWMIEGDGQFAVIPTNRPPAHTAYRYAARGWVQLEAGSSAQFKLLYFDASGRYIGENRGAVCFKQEGWQKLTMIDDLAKHPDATYLSLALTLIGKGKALFDDLELLAFDAGKLPKNFETEYGAVATHHSAVFDRWVGRWTTTTEYKPTSGTPERTLKGEVVVRKVLEDKFLLWEWRGEGNVGSYISLLAFDEYVSGYHIWLFGDRGEVFERIGAWDAASQTLTLQLKSPSPGVTGTSSDRFVNNDRIESSLLVKGADGQVSRDVRMTWLRKGEVGEAKIERARGPAKESPELSVLSKMAGVWSIRSIKKPSIWSPDGKEEHFTEENDWILGGRFLLTRAYDESRQMTSLAIWNYEPQEKSYRYRHFAKDVFGGQWRITWDESSRAFHWRSIDMPTGWVGTGYNRWVDDDNFDNEARIKDEQGRLLLDSKQLKRREK